MPIVLELSIDGRAGAGDHYLTWAPTPATLRVLHADDEEPITVTVRNGGVEGGGRLVFATTGAATDSVTLSLPADGQPVPFTVAGRFGAPSVADGDAAVAVDLTGSDGPPLTVLPVMVRIRKDAEALTDAERDRFLMALARLNNQGAGPFQSFRQTHLESTSLEAHGLDGFPPWHRAYVLDLERELQLLDPAVTVPYWRFDRPAPRLFTPEFIGDDDPASGFARLAPANPLSVWSTDGQLGIIRSPFFDTTTSPAHDDTGQGVLTEDIVVGFGGSFAVLREGYEQNPHGAAHVSFAGSIRSIGTAARDPLFFLLHCNVDRLWAKWQWFQQRFDGTDPMAYSFQGAAGAPGATRIGHNLLDSMWPWNNVTVLPRPTTAPRTPFPGSPVAVAPGPAPTIGAMIDYQGVHTPAARLGFDYDDVPYQP